MKHKLKTFLLLSSLSTFVIYILNRFLFSITTIKSKLDNVKYQYYEWRFGKIRYSQKGNGTPILLLHDLTSGSSLYEFHKIEESLSENHEVFCIDFLGYGHSDKPNMTYTTYLYVQMINEFIKNVIGKKTSIIASGESCPVSIMICHNDPELVDKMMFINPQSIYKSNLIPSRQTKLFKLMVDCPVIGTFIYHLFNNKNYFHKMFTEYYFHNSLAVDEQDIYSYLEASHYPDHTAKYSYSSYIGKYMNTNIIHALKEINHSILVIGGEYEEEIDTTIENYHYYNNSIESAIIPFTKHLPHLEKPDKILNYTDIFFDTM